jgi:Tim17/Tim22/Tim23/Pmp24 family
MERQHKNDNGGTHSQERAFFIRLFSQPYQTRATPNKSRRETKRVAKEIERKERERETKMTSNMSTSDSENDNNNSDLGAPLPNFGSARSIQLQTIAPALGVPQAQLGGLQHAATPDYLDYDPKGRGIVVTMFANAGCAYLLGITGGGFYGFKTGLAATPSTRFRIQLNSVLNHCGRHGSRGGNTMGVFAVLYSFYEGMADQV